MKKIKKILYFIEGSVPGEDDLQMAEKMNGNVCFRNAWMDAEGTYIEDADEVAGKAPARYEAKYKKIELDSIDSEVEKKKKLETVKWNPNK